MTIHAVPAADEPNRGEKITRTETTTTTEVIKPGIFGRLARALQRRPIATSVGLSVGAGAAAAGGYNYRRYGSVLPPVVSASDVGDVVRAVAAAIGR